MCCDPYCRLWGTKCASQQEQLVCFQLDPPTPTTPQQAIIMWRKPAIPYYFAQNLFCFVQTAKLSQASRFSSKTPCLPAKQCRLFP